MNGIINVLKPPGMSSSGVVSYIRKLTGEKKVGHAGTLDPGAAGVLPVCVGRSTRLSDYLMENGKEYIAEVSFGRETDTLDTYGTVLRESTCAVKTEDVLRVLPQFRGTILQTPPAYSALKVNGVPAYKLARKGEAVSKPPREINIYELEYLSETGENRHLLRVKCSKGTYIRVLAQDLGRALGVPAHMSFLLRSQAGGLDISEAYTCDELAELCKSNDFGFLKSPDSALGELPRLDLPKFFDSMIKNGVAIRNQNPPEGDFRVYCGGVFLGIGCDQEGVKLRIPLYELK